MTLAHKGSNAGTIKIRFEFEPDPVALMPNGVPYQHTINPLMNSMYVGVQQSYVDRIEAAQKGEIAPSGWGQAPGGFGAPMQMMPPPFYQQPGGYPQQPYMQAQGYAPQIGQPVYQQAQPMQPMQPMQPIP